MEFVQIYPVLAKKLIVKKEDWYLISELVVFIFSPFLLNVHLLQLHLVEEGAQLLQSLVTQLTIIFGEKCQHW